MYCMIFFFFLFSTEHNALFSNLHKISEKVCVHEHLSSHSATPELISTGDKNLRLLVLKVGLKLTTQESWTVRKVMIYR